MSIWAISLFILGFQSQDTQVFTEPFFIVTWYKQMVLMNTLFVSHWKIKIMKVLGIIRFLVATIGI